MLVNSLMCMDLCAGFFEVLSFAFDGNKVLILAAYKYEPKAIDE